MDVFNPVLKRYFFSEFIKRKGIVISGFVTKNDISKPSFSAFQNVRKSWGWNTSLFDNRYISPKFYSCHPQNSNNEIPRKSVPKCGQNFLFAFLSFYRLTTTLSTYIHFKANASFLINHVML